MATCRLYNQSLFISEDGHSDYNRSLFISEDGHSQILYNHSLFISEEYRIRDMKITANQEHNHRSGEVKGS